VDRLILHSYAKLNLYLEVLNKRRDNYHNLKTVFEKIDLCDKIILTPRRDTKIRLTCNLSSLAKGRKNLAYQSAKLLQGTFGADKGVDIRIIKQVPQGAGLGGGSSNAASVLLGLNQLWGLGLAKDKLVALAKKIGSDVPFFIYHTSFAQGQGRGDRIKPLPQLKIKLWHILVIPKIRALTPFIYKRWDRDFKTFKLTLPKYDVKMLLLALSQRDLSLLGEVMFNSLEQVTSNLYPVVSQIRKKLEDSGLKSILMSGSGPAVFGITSSRKEAATLYRQLKARQKSWRVYLSRTV
jgi:4-diphosphocytidyl-2-C-methyl-D-erythritol kinase